MIAIEGMWIAGEHAGVAGWALDMVGDRLCVQVADGTTVLGEPEDFRSRDGASGEVLLATLLPAPSMARLFTGTVREALACAHSTAMFGPREGRTWESPASYVIDDGEGGDGIVEFGAEGVVAAVRTHDEWRPYTVGPALEAAPAGLRARLTAVCHAPMLQPNGGIGITAVFWSRDGVLESEEPWHEVYIYGGSLFARELQEDDEWVPEAARHYDISERVTECICRLARRRDSLAPLIISAEELDVVIPRDARRRDDGLEALLAGGAVLCPTAR